AILFKSKEADVIGKALISLFAQWGAPLILQSDNGKEFTANIVKHICEALGIMI
ncbi:8645_t:CDS:1, partial [Dentiscutata erythropus]